MTTFTTVIFELTAAAGSPSHACACVGVGVGWAETGQALGKAR